MDYPMKIDSKGNFVFPTTSAQGAVVYIDCKNGFSPSPPECGMINPPTPPIQSVPEPMTYMLIVIGLMLIVLFKRYLHT